MNDEPLCSLEDLLACSLAGIFGATIGVAVIVLVRWRRLAQ